MNRSVREGEARLQAELMVGFVKGGGVGAVRLTRVVANI